MERSFAALRMTVRTALKSSDEVGKSYTSHEKSYLQTSVISEVCLIFYCSTVCSCTMLSMVSLAGRAAILRYPNKGNNGEAIIVVTSAIMTSMAKSVGE